MKTSGAQSMLKSGSTTSSAGEPLPPPASPSSDKTPRALSLNCDSKADGPQDLIPTNVATDKPGSTSHLSKATAGQSGLPKINKQCLPRGGTYLSTIVGPIQVGIPPETIKDSMTHGLPIPQYYVIPQETFCRTLGNSLGVNVAEFEFPAYYNFFLKGQTVKLIVDSVEAEERVRALMQETLLGPEEIDAAIDFDRSVPMSSRPDIAKELSYFRSFNGKELSVDLLITFIHMGSEGFVTIDGAEGTPSADWCVTIAASDTNGGEYIVTEHRRDPDAPTVSDDECDSPGDSRPPSDTKGSADGDHADGVGGEQQTANGLSARGGSMLRAETMRKHMSIDLCEVGGECHSDKSEEQFETTEPDACSDGGEGRPGRGGKRREEARRKTADNAIIPQNEASERHPRFTPTPPQRRPVSSSPEEEGSGSSIAKRFAKWIVQTAHIGGKASGGVGLGTGSERQVLDGGDDGEKSSGIGGGGGAPLPLPRRRWRAVCVKGYVPVRVGHASMTCPLPTKLPFHPDQTEEEFDAPMFGTTVLGNSHGFDPKGSTSGYVLWINGRGYMIDPPPYASMILQAFNIRPSLIAGVIVTHCHADHDAGTFQKVLLDGQVNIISTRTIYESFIRKYTALSGMSSELIRSSHKFTPVTIGQPLRLNGASFNFFYTLHSIPCIGFEVMFQDKGMSFSADHMNDPARVRAMCEEGYMSKGRRDALLNFPWHHDAIFHEAGIPPIHTPMQTLQELPDDVKKRLYVVHVSESSIPEGSGLQVAPAGVENTIRLPTEINPCSGAIALLELISSVGILKDISVAQARSLLEVGKLAKFEAGTSIQHRNTDTTDFAIIRHGKAASTVIKEAGCRRSFSTQKTFLRRGDCYGEELLLEGSVRRKSAVTIVALTDIEVMLFNGLDLEHIIGLKTKTLEDTYRLDRLLVYNSVLSALTRKQILQLETFTEVKNLVAGEMVWTEGEPVEKVVLVAKGKLAFVNAGKRTLISGSYPQEGRRLAGGETPRLVFCPKHFLPGSLIGRAGTLLDPPGSNHYKHSLRAVMDSVVLEVSREDMTTFSYSNPGVFMAINDLQFVC